MESGSRATRASVDLAVAVLILAGVLLALALFWRRVRDTPSRPISVAEVAWTSVVVLAFVVVVLLLR